MIKYTLVNPSKLTEMFDGMRPPSKIINSGIYSQLKSSGRATIHGSNIIGHEFLLWLERAGVVKRL